MRPIHISTSPNLEWDDVKLATKVLLTGGVEGDAEKVEKWLEKYFGGGIRAITFNSGRSALWAILKAMGIEKGDKVAVLGFTCVVVPNSVLWLGAKPIFIDINPETLNMSVKDLEHKLDQGIKAVIFQDSFGMGEGIEEIVKLCKKKKVWLIEDAALSLGGGYKGKKYGSWGDAAILSFGRDKVVSSVFGGAAITSNRLLGEKIRKIQADLPTPSKTWIRQQLWHPIMTWVALQLYELRIGKIVLWGCQKLNILSRAVYREEKVGIRPMEFPAKYPNELAKLALQQLGKLSRFHRRRQEISEKYFSGLTFKTGLPVKNNTAYLRFPIRIQNPEKIVAKARNLGWVWDRWYDQNIMPADDQKEIGYISGSCPEAEMATTEIINLPTYPTLADKQVDNIIEKMNIWCK